jgi:hypothetical protein
MFHKGQGIAWLAESLLASEKELCFMESVSQLNIKIYALCEFLVDFYNGDKDYFISHNLFIFWKKLP